MLGLVQSLYRCPGYALGLAGDTLCAVGEGPAQPVAGAGVAGPAARVPVPGGRRWPELVVFHASSVAGRRRGRANG
ncbi:MAG: hypothetical protein JWL99_4052, partial [Streptomyces oryziradicis]|nr:hypothetical protein [Actinacidiphila oryziradicis]